MKLTIAWNVWKNYDEVLLGSEIARLSERERSRFESLRLIAQGGYEVPPSPAESRHLDAYFHVAIREDYPAIKIHGKYKAAYRVLEGLKNAYRYAAENGSDYALVTNADAWCLDHDRLAALLEDPEVRRCAISARVGKVTGLWLSWGDYVPVFDDHFLIINVAECRRHGVFDYDEPKTYRCHFPGYGGIHYMLGALFDERVPPGLFNAYTDLSDCVNHFGEPSGFSLLPWQFQPSYAFLHANCAQEPFLHPLRAEQLRLYGLDRFPEAGAYCARHPRGRAVAADRERGYAFLRRTPLDALRCAAIFGLKRLNHAYQRHVVHRAWLKHENRPRSDGRMGALSHYDRYAHVLPPTLASRRPGSA